MGSPIFPRERTGTHSLVPMVAFTTRETKEGEDIKKNREEYDSFMNCKIPFPKNIRLAAIELFLLERPIVAMEYLETGAGAFGAHSVRTFLYGMGGEFTDIHGENVRIDKDSNWVITDW